MRMLLVAFFALALGASRHVSAQTAPAQEVTVNFLTQGEPDTLDPNRASFAYAVDGAVVRQVFEPLLRFDDKLVPQPAAAQSYEVSLDGTTYTFHLRPDGRWSDGQPVSAGQFVYSWNRLLAPSLHAQYAPLFASAGITSVSAPDDLTFQVQLSQPFGALPDLAALWQGVPLRPDIVGADPTGWATDPSTYVGNGPFMLEDWVHGDHLTLVPNPAYEAHLGWPKPTLTRVTVRMDANPEADFAAFSRPNGPDWIVVPDAEVNQVLNDPGLAPLVRKDSELTTFWLQFNNTRAPLSNVLVRRALSKSIDRQALVRDLATGVSVPTTSVIPTGMPGFQDGLGHELDFDAAGARALLQQAGVASQPLSPFSLKFSFPDTPDDLRRAEYLQSQLVTNLPIDVQLDPLDAAAYQKAIDTHGYDMLFGGWSADYPDPQDWFAMVFGCKGAYNTSGYCNSNLDQLVARADTGAVLPARLALYAQAQTALMQDAPVAPLFVRGGLALVQPWVASTDGASADGGRKPLTITALDDYPGSLFLDKVQILPK